MAEITPTPQVGTWLRITSWDEEWTPQPQVGTWLRITGWSGFPWIPTPRRHGRHLGLGRGSRTVG